MFVGMELRLFIYAWKTKDKARYSARAQIKASLLAPLFCFGHPWFLLLGSCGHSSFKNSAVNAAIVKGKMLDYDKALKKDESLNEK